MVQNWTKVSSMARLLMKLFFLIITLFAFKLNMLKETVEASFLAHDTYYAKVEDLTLGLNNSLDSWKGINVIQCATKCSSDSNCWCFFWNSLDGSCTTGSTINGGMTTSGTATARLYTLCRFDLGYQLWSFGSSLKCVHMSSSKENYETANKTCKNHGGRLYMANSLEFIDLLFNFALEERGIKQLEAFIGLDDVDKEDSFVWSDGQELTDQERKELFYPNQPDNYLDGEDCVIISKLRSPLNDAKCKSKYFFVCEVDFSRP